MGTFAQQDGARLRRFGPKARPMQHSLWTGRACVTYAVLVLLTVAAGTPVSDRFISGNWAVQGLGKLNATFITPVIGMSGSWHPAAEESEAGVDDETELRPVM